MTNKQTEYRIRKKGKMFQACEYTKSIKGINPWYCSRIILSDCETIHEAQGAIDYMNGKEVF